ncbi:transporter substrate-binding domain-containing protein [Photobacterium sp. 1_MG-2023]|uniref:transporter substrate-binding domain-containing protein n=1 Tax=Photobacterium sp. 1_MG-2023 TaxID=3062646 RepID=UPI0026E137A0|nr:transporter substrate-binding domain-containing protein [Photobacterium sp. 1_MG-2023]MDO6707967.1 transporter substrate-binding domain-containing protein [Photobacterium sp. 1_MG-2023]
MSFVLLNQAHAASSRLQKVIDRGVLRVGTTGDWGPMTMRDPATNFYKGYDIDITTELAKDLGVTVEYVATDWKALVSGIVTEKYDLTGSAALNINRAKIVGYSQPYYYLAFVPVTQKQYQSRFRFWADFNTASVTVASRQNSVEETMVKEFFPKARQRVLESGKPYQELLSNRANVIVTSNIEAATLTSRFPQLAVPHVQGMRRATPLAMLMPRDDQVWINFINHWIELKKTQGFFDRIAEKWGLVVMEVE